MPIGPGLAAPGRRADTYRRPKGRCSLEIRTTCPLLPSGALPSPPCFYARSSVPQQHCSSPYHLSTTVRSNIYLSIAHVYPLEWKINAGRSWVLFFAFSPEPKVADAQSLLTE